MAAMRKRKLPSENLARKKRKRQRPLSFSAMETGDFAMLEMLLAENPDLAHERDLNGMSLIRTAAFCIHGCAGSTVTCRFSSSKSRRPPNRNLSVCTGALRNAGALSSGKPLKKRGFPTFPEVARELPGSFPEAARHVPGCDTPIPLGGD